MTTNREHITRLDRTRAWTRWTCTCGRRSKLYAFPGYADRAGRQHAQATGGMFRDY